MGTLGLLTAAWTFVHRSGSKRAERETRDSLRTEDFHHPAERISSRSVTMATEKRRGAGLPDSALTLAALRI